MNNNHSFISIVKTEKKFLSRYATLFASIFGLLAVTAAFFFLGQSIANESRKNTDLLNAIGLGKTLSQQISKEILVIQKEWSTGQKFNTKSFESLAAAANTFDVVRNGFKNGSEYKVGDSVRKVHVLSEEYGSDLRQIENAWAPLRAQIDVLGKVYRENALTKKTPTKREEFIAGRKTFSTEINESNKDFAFPSDDVNLLKGFVPLVPSSLEKEVLGAEITKTSNTYNQYADELSMTVEKLNVRLNTSISVEEAKNARYQFAMTAASLFLFILLTFYFLRRNIVADYVISTENREKKAILTNVNEGLFLMDNKWMVASAGSNFLEKLFGQAVPVGSSFAELMTQCAGAESFASAQKYVRILLEKKVKAHLIGSLNPWKLVPINVLDKEGHPSVKHVSVTFGPIYDESGALKSVLVNLSDSTDKKKLADELSAEVKRNKDTFRMLASLSASPMRGEIIEYFKKLRTLLEISNTSIKDSGSNEIEVSKLVKRLKDDVHGYKSEAGVLGLDLIKKYLHDLESALISIEKKGDFQYDKMLSIPYMFKDIYESINFLESMIEATEGSRVQPKIKFATTTDVMAFIDSMVEKTAGEYGKIVSVRWRGEEEFPVEHLDLLRTSLGHIVKNAVIHGIEKGEQRKERKKSNGTIKISAVDEGSLVKVSVLDDGAGLDVRKIYELAKEKGLVEGSFEDTAQKNIVDMIFKEDFSTSEGVDMDSGRGTGLHFVKSRLEELGGSVSVESVVGKGTEFTLRFPK